MENNIWENLLAWVGIEPRTLNLSPQSGALNLSATKIKKEKKIWSESAGLCRIDKNAARVNKVQKSYQYNKSDFVMQSEDSVVNVDTINLQKTLNRAKNFKHFV